MRTALEIAFGFGFVVATLALLFGVVALSIHWQVRMANATIGSAIAIAILIVGAAVLIANLPKA